MQTGDVVSTITYLKGDATCPQAAGNKILCHVCNDAGHWAKGFVVAISKRWKEPEKEFRRWATEREGNDFALGAVQFVQVEPDLRVANHHADGCFRLAREPSASRGSK